MDRKSGCSRTSSLELNMTTLWEQCYCLLMANAAQLTDTNITVKSFWYKTICDSDTSHCRITFRFSKLEHFDTFLNSDYSSVIWCSCVSTEDCLRKALLSLTFCTKCLYPCYLIDFSVDLTPSVFTLWMSQCSQSHGAQAFSVVGHALACVFTVMLNHTSSHKEVYPLWEDGAAFNFFSV